MYAVAAPADALLSCLQGEDLVCMVPCDYVDDALTPVLLRASLKDSVSAAAPTHHEYCAEAALAAASGKLYLLGGRHEGGPHAPGDPSRLEVYEPHTGAWYSASSPLPPHSRLLDHALVANKTEGLLLALGGTVRLKPTQGRIWAAAPADVWDRHMVAKYDIKAGGWVASNALSRRWACGPVHCMGL
jgi:hypothetical protein